MTDSAEQVAREIVARLPKDHKQRIDADVVEGALFAALRSSWWRTDVEVKKLEWPPQCPRGQRVHNRPALVEYTIAHYGGDSGSDTVYRWASIKAAWSGALDSYDEAKAAAQADFEQRIRSALVLPQPPASTEG